MTIPKDFEQVGFLTKSYPQLEELAWKDSERFRQIADSVNRLAQESLYLLTKAKSGDIISVARVTLYLHIVQSFQGTLLLLQRGMEGHAAASIRIALEGLFKLVALALDKNCIVQFVTEQLLQQINYGEALLEIDRRQANSERKLFTPEQVASTRSKIREHRRTIVDMGANKFASRWTAKEWAEKAGMLQMYLLQYAMWCQPAHASAQHLETFFLKDESGEIKEINPLPKFRNFRLYVHTACVIVLEALNHVDDLAKRSKGKAPIKIRRSQLLKKLQQLDIS